MRELEYKIFAKALENAYGSVLLGENQALTFIEHLVYLNRALADSPQIYWPLESELLLIRRVCEACWPERTFELCLADKLSASLQVRRETLFDPVCRMLLDAAAQGTFPDTLRLSRSGEALRYYFVMGDSIWRQGVVGYE